MKVGLEVPAHCIKIPLKFSVKEAEMYKTKYLLVAISLLVILLGAACSSNQPAPVANVPPPASNESGSTAPVCQGSVSCVAPVAEQYQLDCIKKVPYTNVSVPTGTTFEVMDKSGEFNCVDSGTVANGKEVLTCHGKELFTFDLKLTNTSCSGASLATGTGQCQEGYGYDAANQCCSPVTGNSGGSTTIQVNLGGCPIPKGIYP
jgi:hypothetical protein